MNAPPDQQPNPFPTEILASMFTGPEPTEVIAEYVWGARPCHRDDLIRRDRYEDGEPVERLYCLMDYFNPVAVIDAAGEVQERYAWSAFGLRTVLDPAWEPREGSAFAFEFGFHGQFLDAETGFYNYGYRYYSIEIGRWLSRDPLFTEPSPLSSTHSVNLYHLLESLWEELLSGTETNLYAFANNRPVNAIDILGLFEVTFKVVTDIRRVHGILVPPGAQGVKTTHEIVFETDTGDIVRRSDFTAKTFGFFPASSGFFEDVWKDTSGGKCVVHATMFGWAKNWANPFLGSINYDLKLEIDLKAIPQTMKLTGKHDGFPSYEVNFDYGFYDFDEISVDKLKEPMDITVNETRP